MYRPGQITVRVEYKWGAAGWGNGICLYLDWNALMAPQKAILETACVHFLDSYPIDVSHLRFSILCLLLL